MMVTGPATAEACDVANSAVLPGAKDVQWRGRPAGVWAWGCDAMAGADQPCDGGDGANGEIAPPVLTNATLSGRA